jgi:tetratricopeptide (TPR) repeat protein
MRRYVFIFLLTGFFISCTAPNEKTLYQYVKAQGLYSEGRFAETAKFLEDIKPFHPGMVLRGKAQYFGGDLSLAEKTLRRALRMRSSSVEARIYLVRILREQKKNSEAEKILESILADDPANIRALRMAADFANEKGANGKAESLAFLDRAAEAGAETALVYVDRAKIRWIMGKGKPALEDLDRAKAMLPWDTPLVKSIENLESVIKEALR